MLSASLCRFTTHNFMFWLLVHVASPRPKHSGFWGLQPVPVIFPHSLALSLLHFLSCTSSRMRVCAAVALGVLMLELALATPAHESASGLSLVAFKRSLLEEDGGEMRERGETGAINWGCRRT